MLEAYMWVLHHTVTHEWCVWGRDLALLLPPHRAHSCWQRCWRRERLRLTWRSASRTPPGTWRSNFWMWWRPGRMRHRGRRRREHSRGRWWPRLWQKTWGNSEKTLFSSTHFQSLKLLISFFRIGENKLLKEQQKVESKREGEEIQQLTELYQWEQRMERERQVKQKKDLMQAHVVGSKQGNEPVEGTAAV